jgi:PQQ enzyme repeat
MCRIHRRRYSCGRYDRHQPAKPTSPMTGTLLAAHGCKDISSHNLPQRSAITGLIPKVSPRFVAIARCLECVALRHGGLIAVAATWPLTGQRKWQVPLTDVPSSAGMLVTGGGLVFTGKLTGEFLALDEDTGQTLWQFQTSSSVNSTAITYTHKGRQYVTVASGLGGGLARRAIGGAVPTGGSLWTFAIMAE